MSEELDLSKVKKFVQTVKRTTLQDHPLAPGSIAVFFTEDENGKPISELITELLATTSIKDIQFKNDVLALKYWINVEISTAPTDADTQDLRVGLSKLDNASINYRVELATDEKEKIKESARRPAANVHVKGLYDIGDYVQEFDTCCLDVSEVDIKDIETNLVFVAAVAQRENPTVYVISTELANKLMTKDYKDSPLHRMFSTKIKQKSVYAPEKSGNEVLANPFVRLCY